MIRKISPFILLFVFSFLSAQIPDLKDVKKNMADEKSLFYYEKLLYRFKGLPKSMNQEEGQYLYYGQNFRGEKVSSSDQDFKSMIDDFKTKNYQQASAKGVLLLQKDPFSFNVLMVVLQAFEKQNDPKNFIYYLDQYRLLVNTMMASGDGKSEKTAYVVNSVSDEYVLLNVLQKNPDLYTRSSKPTKNGMFDIWTSINEKLYVKVIYTENL